MRAESLPPPQPPVQIKLLYKKLHVEVQCTCSTPVHEIPPDITQGSMPLGFPSWLLVTRTFPYLVPQLTYIYILPLK